MSLTIKSTSGNPDDTIVSAANSSHNVFKITTDYVNISGFTVKGATEGWETSGILLYGGAEYCNISDNNVSNNVCGIYILYSHYNTITNNTASNNANCEFYAGQHSLSNKIKDLTICSYPTTISLIYEGGIKIKSVKIPDHEDPAGKVNISKYVDVAMGAWILLNVSYNDADVTHVEEASLRLYRSTDTEWVEIPGSGVNTAENYVYANVTSFSQIAPFGNPKTPGVKIYTDKTVYHQGDTQHLGLDVTNPGAASRTVILAIWMELPDKSIYVLYYASVYLPAKFDYSNPNQMEIPMRFIPDGKYTWNAALIDPVTGEWLSYSTAEWKFSFRGTATEDITTVLEQIKISVVIDFEK